MQKKTKTTRKQKKDDPCPICDKELYLDHEYTQRVGLLDDFDEVTGWMCPHCKSEFDVDNHLTKFMGKPGLRGEA
jgi:transposase-like protein